MKTIVTIGLLFLAGSAGCAFAQLEGERGTATYTPESSKGKLMASGARHDPAQLTAAHPKHVLGARLEIRRLDTGARVQVLVEDRMHRHDGRIISLSHAAARRLDMLEEGTAEVAIRILTEPHVDALHGGAAVIARRFHGRRTASGEIYNQNSRTAAHRSLPFGTRVRVYVRSTSQTTTVRINDRTARDSKPIINLSTAAAKDLGIPAMGKALVILEVLDSPDAGEPGAP